MAAGKAPVSLFAIHLGGLLTPVSSPPSPHPRRLTHVLCLCSKCGGQGLSGQACNECGARNWFGPRYLSNSQQICINGTVATLPENRPSNWANEPKVLVERETRCRRCDGAKVVHDKSTLTVVVEKGVDVGHRITFEEASNQHPGMIPGDLVLVVVELGTHPRFIRKRHNLVHKRVVSAEEAALGLSFQLEHLDGRKIQVTTTPGQISPPVTSHVIPGEGFPLYDLPLVKGDLIIIFTVEAPVLPRGPGERKALPPSSPTSHLLSSSSSSSSLSASASSSSPPSSTGGAGSSSRSQLDNFWRLLHRHEPTEHEQDFARKMRAARLFQACWREHRSRSKTKNDAKQSPLSAAGAASPGDAGAGITAGAGRSPSTEESRRNDRMGMVPSTHNGQVDVRDRADPRPSQQQRARECRILGAILRDVKQAAGVSTPNAMQAIAEVLRKLGLPDRRDLKANTYQAAEQLGISLYD